MSVFLLILKIIGITLLVLILLLLLIVGLVLFVPFRYRGLLIKGADKGDLTIDFSVSFLLHFINMLIRYTDKLFYRVRITIFTVVSSEKKPKEKKKKLKRAKSSRNEINKNITNSKSMNIDSEEKKPDSTSLIEMNDNDLENNSLLEIDDACSTSEQKKDFISGILDCLDKIVDFILKMIEFSEKIIDLILNLPDSIGNIYNSIVNKIDDIINNIDYYLYILDDDRNKAAVVLCLNEISKILKNIKPSKINGFVHFGFEDPYLTGQIMAVCGILNPLIYDKIDIKGEFEKDILESKISIKGRVTLFVLIKTAFKLYFSKDLRRLKRLLSREGK